MLTTVWTPQWRASRTVVDTRYCGAGLRSGSKSKTRKHRLQLGPWTPVCGPSLRAFVFLQSGFTPFFSRSYLSNEPSCVYRAHGLRVSSLGYVLSLVTQVTNRIESKIGRASCREGE